MASRSRPKVVSTELSKASPPLLKRQQATLRSRAMNQAAKLLSRLSENALGELVNVRRNDEGELERHPTEMSAAQVKAAEIVLRKVLPDLQQVELEQFSEERRRTPEEVQAGILAFFKDKQHLLEGLEKGLSGRDDEVVIDVGEAHVRDPESS